MKQEKNTFDSATMAPNGSNRVYVAQYRRASGDWFDTSKPHTLQSARADAAAANPMIYQARVIARLANGSIVIIPGVDRRFN